MSQKSLYEQVFDNNREWVAKVKANDASFFEKLAKGQDPEFLFIGCSDSRVPACQITGTGPGDIFVHRNVANVVCHTDDNIQAVIEYAVAHLGVRHIVVCGHSNCGGVGAAMAGSDLGVLNPYLRQIRDVYYNNLDELDALPEAERYARLIELNVEAQALNVAKTSAVQAAWAKGDKPQIHGWVFALETGLLKDLNLDFSDQREQLKARYHVS